MELWWWADGDGALHALSWLTPTGSLGGARVVAGGPVFISLTAGTLGWPTEMRLRGQGGLWGGALLATVREVRVLL